MKYPSLTRRVLYVLAAYFLILGLYIFFAPTKFYELTPGLAEMGPYNFHFIRDISFVFLSVGIAMFYGTRNANQAVVVCAAIWPFMHALFHFQIWVHRGFPFDTIWISDLSAVIMPGVIALWVGVRFKQ